MGSGGGPPPWLPETAARVHVAARTMPPTMNTMVLFVLNRRTSNERISLAATATPPASVGTIESLLMMGSRTVKMTPSASVTRTAVGRSAGINVSGPAVAGCHTWHPVRRERRSAARGRGAKNPRVLTMPSLTVQPPSTRSHSTTTTRASSPAVHERVTRSDLATPSSIEMFLALGDGADSLGRE